MVELVIFVLMGATALAGALAVVLGRNPVYGAMGLLATLFSLAVFYVVHLAHFAAVVQVIVYAGAVITLFLFVIMFIGVDRAERMSRKRAVPRPLVLIIAAGAVVAVGALAVTGRFDPVITDGAPVETATGSVEEIGNNLISVPDPEGGRTASPWLPAFEATGALLAVAAVGAIALAFHRARPGNKTAAEEGEGPEAER